VFARILLPAPAGSVLADLPQRAPLELIGGAVRSHALARFGCCHAALSRVPSPSASAATRPAPPARTRSTRAMTRPGSRVRTRSTSAATRPSRGPAAAARAQPVRRLARAHGGAGAVRGCCPPPALAVGGCRVPECAGDVGVP
jgi:hypothetical protein